ncbi:AMP-binding protein [Novosphingobium album (ex Liu et al. 2023)]|uniref:AMP-binding protein n=1 Tax=Novosphingobium album (ex Liu et al. 2023) TaxID=3031130 RepID=A0ABT5WX88_9SPHN|nr:AMP-binding protein [Novosphingobium album (ex Liu et al. 2023)]MDE8654523.1 AMP-binding protein [Novosphingobium album (ex Liu et al. 2023)]
MITYPDYQTRFPPEQWALPTVLEHQARTIPDHPFLSWTDAGTPRSFAETNREVNRIAHGLAALGIGKGDLVGLFLPNCVEYVLAWFALAKLGAVEVAICDMYKGAFLEHPINLAGARMVVTTPELLPLLAEIEAAIPTVEHIIVIAGADLPAPSFARITTSRFADLYSANDSNPGIAVSPRDLGAVLLTSGTTGPSKGVMMPHSQFYFFAEEDIQILGLTGEDVYMTGFPLFHGNAQFLTVYPCLIVGAHCVLYPRFSATDFIGRARRSGATVTNLLGATMAFILAQPEAEGERDHRLRAIYAAPLSPDLGDRFVARFGPVDFVDGFGQTEISMPFMTPRGVPRPAGASGVLNAQWFDVRLIDPDTGRDVEPGKPGELLVRNKADGIMAMGYIGMAEKTVEAWRDLWFHTGDSLKRDEDGWYYFVGRVKDALRRRGENISAFEVEAVVRGHAAIAECAVIGVRADQAAGEDEVKACVVLVEDAQLDIEDLIRWCEKRMPGFMVPRYVEVYDRLPQTPSEKVKKNELREAGITPATWDRVAAGVMLAGERKPPVTA